MPFKAGDRVGAVMSATKEEVFLFGFGVYMGDEFPPDDIIGPFGIPMQKPQNRFGQRGSRVGM